MNLGFSPCGQQTEAAGTFRSLNTAAATDRPSGPDALKTMSFTGCGRTFAMEFPNQGTTFVVPQLIVKMLGAAGSNTRGLHTIAIIMLVSTLLPIIVSPPKEKTS